MRVPAFPQHRQDVLKWNGWGYNDAAFELDDKGVFFFKGKMYALGSPRCGACAASANAGRGGTMCTRHEPFVCECGRAAHLLRGHLRHSVFRRYDFGGTIMPLLRPWMEEERAVDFTKMAPAQVCSPRARR